MSRSSELVTWLCARLEDLVARVQLVAPAAIVNVDTHTHGDELTSCASCLATPDAPALDLGFTLVREGEQVRLSASLRVAGSSEILAELGPIVSPEQQLDTPALREQLLAFIQVQESRMVERLHAEARGSEHEAELIERLREQAARSHARGEFDEARSIYRALTMLACDEADLGCLIRIEAEALREHLARLIERFPSQRDVITKIANSDSAAP
jgi:hypothetical protein